jgi:hypothetical protein
MTFDEMKAIFSQPNIQTGMGVRTLTLKVHGAAVDYPRESLVAVCDELKGRMEMISAGIVPPSETDKFLAAVLMMLAGNAPKHEAKDIR